jgi:hypothetical protein
MKAVDSIPPGPTPRGKHQRSFVRTDAILWVQLPRRVTSQSLIHQQLMYRSGAQLSRRRSRVQVPSRSPFKTLGKSRGFLCFCECAGMLGRRPWSHNWTHARSHKSPGRGDAVTTSAVQPAIHPEGRVQGQMFRLPVDLQASGRARGLRVDDGEQTGRLRGPTPRGSDPLIYRRKDAILWVHDP